MNKKNARRGLGAALAVAAAGVLAAWTASAAGASPAAATHTAAQAPSHCAQTFGGSTKHGKIAGIIHPKAIGCKNTTASRNSNAANGTPPLLFHGGNVMGTAATGPVVVTPIYWTPSDHTIPSDYSGIINTYWNGVALSSHRTDNVYSILGEYSGANGQIKPGMVMGGAINDTNPLPTSGCTVASNDGSGIYSDGTGYDACLDDAQVQAETAAIVSANNLPVDLAHIYVLYLPKHVESCFNAGPTNVPNSVNQCTINFQPSATFCAYHSQESNGIVYANMPFPVYASSTGFTCGSDARFPTVQSPNGNPDADTEISPSSHEVNEAITDPDTMTGWYDSSFFENGDECAYVFGPTRGAAGALYNQNIGNHHYLTQEEFSNNDFANTGLGCKQGETSISPIGS